MSMKLRLQSRIRNIGDRAVGPSILTLEVIRDAAEAIDVPILKGVTGILLTILQAVAKAKSNVETSKALVERAGRIVLAINRHISRDGITMTAQFRANVVRLEDTMKGIQEFVYRHTRVHVFLRIVHKDSIADAVAAHNQRLDDAVQLFQIESLVTIHTRAEEDARILRRVEAGVAEIQDSLSLVSKETSVQDFEGIPILKLEEIDLDEEIRKGRGYRIHSATYKNKAVIAKAFEGTRAKKLWAENALLNRRLWHPNILQVIGISSPTTEPHVILFNGETHKAHRSIHRLIAHALQIDLTRSVKLGIHLIHGLATGLDYLSSQNVPLSSIGLENFDIFIVAEDKVRIGLSSDSTPRGHRPIARKFRSTHKDDEEWDVLDGLCRKTLEDANSLMRRDNVQRKATSGIRFDMRQNSVNSKLVLVPPFNKDSPRRSFVWNSVVRGKTSLASVSHSFGLYLESFPRFGHPIRRIVSPRAISPKFMSAHTCPGYPCEEVTLTANAYDNAIYSYMESTQRATCDVCGTVVYEKSRNVQVCRVCGMAFEYPSHFSHHMMLRHSRWR